MTCGARALIRPDALRRNFARVRERARGQRIMAAIKGNAYGHGLLTAARCFRDADALAVARLSEAQALRAAGIESALLVLAGIASADEYAEARRLGCELVVHSAAQLPLVEAGGAGTALWVKVDSGMHRLGFDPAEVPAVLDRLAGAGPLRLMTHLATADEPADPLLANQLEVFRQLADGFPGDVSVANSAALFGADGAHADWGQHGDAWVRPGIALYGISPYPEQDGAAFGLEPAMQFESRLLAVKTLAAGERVGYGGRWTAPGDTTLGIVAAGYGDGYSRFLPTGTPLLINGRRVPLVGTVSMDLCAVDLGPGAEDRVGDTVVLWGDGLPVEEVARHAHTIAYQLVTGVMHREDPAVGA